MAQYAFFFDGTRCTGCKTCEFACKDYKDLTTEFAYRKVYEVAGGQTTRDEDGVIATTAFSYPVSSSCQHCDKPACVEGCPTGAMHKDEETGLVSVDTEVCIGCGACATACPYGAPKVNEELGHSTKCDGCAERLAAGLKPVCVLACPARALDFGPVEEDLAAGRPRRHHALLQRRGDRPQPVRQAERRRQAGRRRDLRHREPA